MDVQAIAEGALVGYNPFMRSVLTALFVLGLVLAFAVSAVPALAHDVDCSAVSGDGPAGVDLRAVCTIDAATGRYTHHHQFGLDPAIGMLPLFGGIGIAGVGALAWRILGGRAGRRLEAMTPSDWWQCGACGSLNQPNRGLCYSCRRPYDPSAPRVPTATDAAPIVD
jgi:hypothetical protein